jgi:outer membrane lipoprotein-sorting protein
MTTCDKTNEQLAAFVLGYFSEKEVSEMTRHVVECEDCRVKVKELGKLLECATEIGEASVDEQMCKSAKEAILAAAEEREKRALSPTIKVQVIWRTIMQSRITKFAAAAGIIIAVFVGMNRFVGPIGVTSVAFAQVKKALENVSWMHVVGQEKDEVSEAWLSFGSQIIVQKDNDGKIRYETYAENKRYAYDPDTNTITVSHLSDAFRKVFALGAAGPFELFEKLVQEEHEKGANFTRKNGQYNEAKVEIWEITKSEQARLIEAKLIIDIRKHLPAAMEIRNTLNGTVRQDTRITFEYPDKGPEDIYELGVPRSAVIVDNTSAPNR